MRSSILYAACALGAVALASGAIALRSYARAYGTVHFPRAHVSRGDEARARAEIPGLEDVTLRTADGLTLHGWFSPGPRRAAVIFVHGGAGNRMQLLPEARIIARHGYGFLVYDSRASGESDGDVVTWGDAERLDVRAAVDYLASRPDVDPKRIGALGFSIGGSTVALAAAEDPRIRAVVLYATWTSLEDEMKYKNRKFGFLSWGPVLSAMRRYGVDVDAVRPIDRVARIHPRPLLMIAGDADLDTPVGVMQRVFAAAGPPKDLWIEPGADHGGNVKAAPAEYEARVLTFLDGTLGAP